MGHRLYRPRTTPVIQTIIVIAASKEDLLHQLGVSKVEARRRTIIKAFTLTAVLSGANVNVIGAVNLVESVPPKVISPAPEDPEVAGVNEIATRLAEMIP